MNTTSDQTWSQKNQPNKSTIYYYLKSTKFCLPLSWVCLCMSLLASHVSRLIVILYISCLQPFPDPPLLTKPLAAPPSPPRASPTSHEQLQLTFLLSHRPFLFPFASARRPWSLRPRSPPPLPPLSISSNLRLKSSRVPHFLAEFVK